MDPTSLVSVPPSTLLALREHLRFNESNLSIEQAVVLGIHEWMAGCNHAKYEDVLRGYQWKRVFLPHASQLRMVHDGRSYYAKVVGDDIIYQGRAVSPREFTMAIAGNGRNAWRDVSIRFPGSQHWTQANRYRIEREQSRKAQQLAPGETIVKAAESITETLKTVLMLVEDSGIAAAKHINRRLATTRRDQDRLHDDCAFE